MEEDKDREFRFRFIKPDLTELYDLEQFQTVPSMMGIDFSSHGHNSIINKGIYRNILIDIH